MNSGSDNLASSSLVALVYPECMESTITNVHLENHQEMVTESSTAGAYSMPPPDVTAPDAKDRAMEAYRCAGPLDSQFQVDSEDSIAFPDNEDDHESESDSDHPELLGLWALLQHRLGINFSDMADEPHDQVLSELTLDGIASYIKDGKGKNVIVMTGAGISTSAGIPDFRSPGSGLYANLEKYNLPSPESIFDITYFQGNPDPFYMLAKELYPGNYKPTISHYFISLLAAKGLLRRTYTQNIDGLERRAGIHDDLIVEAHGTFHTSHCLDCKREYTEEWVRDKIFSDAVPRCTQCKGLVKPDIVFFGESLPAKFFQMMPPDFRECDLLIVMGTSLVVQPFASLIDRVPSETPRLLINKEKCGVGLFALFGGFNFDGENKYRDVAWLGTCDDGCIALAEKLGWKEELLSSAAQDGVVYSSPSPAPPVGLEPLQGNANGMDGELIKASVDIETTAACDSVVDKDSGLCYASL